MEDVEFKILAASTQSRLACSGELDEINKRDYLLKVETNIPTCTSPTGRDSGYLKSKRSLNVTWDIK